MVARGRTATRSALVTNRHDLHKGNPSDLGNYRPISLLNTMYKIIAGVIQNRLAGKLDKHLQRTQYGFRKQKGTADAIHCIRRIIDKGESTGTKTLMVLIDWEKKNRQGRSKRIAHRLGKDECVWKDTELDQGAVQQTTI